MPENRCDWRTAGGRLHSRMHVPACIRDHTLQISVHPVTTSSIAAFRTVSFVSDLCRFALCLAVKHPPRSRQLHCQATAISKHGANHWRSYADYLQIACQCYLIIEKIPEVEKIPEAIFSEIMILLC